MVALVAKAGFAFFPVLSVLGQWGAEGDSWVRLWALELEPRERAQLGLGGLILRRKDFIQKACPRAYEEARWEVEDSHKKQALSQQSLPQR